MEWPYSPSDLVNRNSQIDSVLANADQLKLPQDAQSQLAQEQSTIQDALSNVALNPDGTYDEFDDDLLLGLPDPIAPTVSYTSPIGADNGTTG